MAGKFPAGWGQGCCVTDSRVPEAPCTFLEIQYSNELTFKKREASFEHLLTYLINGLPKGSQKIFLGSSLGQVCPFEIIFPEGHTKLAFIKHVLTTYCVVKLQLAKFLMSQ